MLDGFAALGLDVGALRMAAASPEGPDSTPLDGFERLWRAAWQQRPEPTLPVSLGLAIPYGAFGFTDYLAGSSATVGGGFESLALHLRLVARGLTLELDCVDALHWIRIRAVDLTNLREISMAMTAAILVGRFRRATDSGFQPREVHLPIGTADNEAAFAALLQAQVRCATDAALVVDEAAWRLPLRGADPYLQPMLLAALASSGLEVPGDTELQRAIRARLRDALPAGAAAPATIARLLGMSARTLQRRLADGGLSYTALLVDFRRSEATRLLADTDLPLADVAARLGYGEQTSFTRAFRRWTGVTPVRWRASRRRSLRVGRR